MKQLALFPTKSIARRSLQRKRPPLCVDLIYCHGGGTATCCMAVQMGWLYGVNSSHAPCAQATTWSLHTVQFVDCDYRNYDHGKHVEVVARYRPKYATVRDIMTREQCERLNVRYYAFDDILKMAEELERYAEHVIVIPKFDCLHEIPQRYILGYSVPTSYGGTPLPIEKFLSHRIHLLGGTPWRQYQYYRAARSNVVSVDQNAFFKMCRKGFAWMGGYRFVHVDTLLGRQLHSYQEIAFAITLSRVAWLYSLARDDELKAWEEDELCNFLDDARYPDAHDLFTDDDIVTHTSHYSLRSSDNGRQHENVCDQHASRIDEDGE